MCDVHRTCTDSVMQSHAVDSAAGELGQNVTDVKFCRNWYVHFVGSVKIYWVCLAYISVSTACEVPYS